MNTGAEFLFLRSCILLVLVYSSAARLLPTGCSISVNKDLGNPQPLLLLQNGATTDLDAFALPRDDNGTISFRTGQTVDLACPGGSIIVDRHNAGKSVASAECLFDNRFRVEQATVRFDSITCSVVPSHTARYANRKCAGVFDEIEIGFDVDGRFVRHITSCFDKSLQRTLYSKATITSSIGGYQKGYPRPNFAIGGFYNVKPSSADKLYTQNEQRLTINRLLGLPANDTSVIGDDGRYYLARGHYTPKADYVFGAQQRLTFYYVNAAPQWQVFNGGAWRAMELNCRALASERQLDLVVYSGSLGITTLPDVDGNHQEIYLWNRDDKRGIPVPKLMFKVVYEPKSKAGVALISVNNPYNEITEKDIVCRDICHKIGWLAWDRFNVATGYSYCCEVDDFKETATFLPNFNVRRLLL